ncbi:MAG: TIGR04282 family arsenosugar biosynthesis glycosyltransferase [Acidimicrobiales bacterium]
MKHVLVMAKSPVAGQVKTRLCPPCTPREAAMVAEAALADTLDSVVACSADLKVVALSGDPGRWLPAGVAIVAQRGDGLAARLANAWADVGALSGGTGVQIGMDTPQVTAAELDALLDTLPDHDAPLAALGHAVDGGWWAIGLAGADPDAVFGGVPMSRADTGRAQHARLTALGLRVRTVGVKRDIDTFEDLVAVTRTMRPLSRTARAVAALDAGSAVA